MRSARLNKNNVGHGEWGNSRGTIAASELFRRLFRHVRKIKILNQKDNSAIVSQSISTDRFSEKFLEGEEKKKKPECRKRHTV